jgi:thiol-disulfide isomerase/thioredoxin
VDDVREAAGSRQFAIAEHQISQYRQAAGITPQLLEAESWLARGLLEARQYEQADRYAGETRRLAVEMARKAGKISPALETALGAAIEVHAQALAARGERMAAMAFLKTELATYRETAIAPRIQKNINLLSMVGKPAPVLDVSHWLGPRPSSLAQLKGHPVLLFFWAHWCGDCKAEAPVLARIMAAYGSQGLVLIGPTQRYGYAAEGIDATPEQETGYIDQVRRQYYQAIGTMPVPLAEGNFIEYGCSTTPTLVLLDRAGTVRFYHPGAMSYQALADQIKRVLSPPTAGS